MKTIDLDTTTLDLNGVIGVARQQPVLLLTADGQEFGHSSPNTTRPSGKGDRPKPPGFGVGAG